MSPWWLRPAADDQPEQRQAEGGAKARPSEKSRGKRRASKPSDKKTAESPKAKKGSSSRGRDSTERIQKPERPGVAVLIELDFLDRLLASSELESFSAQALREVLAQLGSVHSVRAYGATENHKRLVADCREQGIEAIETPPSEQQTRLAMAIDAMELCLSKRSFDLLALVSNGPGWEPLLTKLRSRGKRIAGIGGPTTEDSEKQFDRYVDLAEALGSPSRIPANEVEPSKATVFALLLETIETVEKRGSGVLWGSVLKREMHRRDPGFKESEHGYTTFSHLLEDADRYQVIQLERDDRSGNYYVADMGHE